MAASVGRGSKNKGANAEREVAKILQPIINEEYARAGLEPPEMKRNLEQTRGGGYDLVGIDWLALEVKRVEQLNINKWWEQTERQAGEGQVGVLIYRQNGKKWKIVMNVGTRIATGKWLATRGEISLEAFKLFFRHKIRHDLSQTSCGQ